MNQATISDPVTLDVREDLRVGNPPCDRIQSTARSVPEGGRFTLVTPFEPMPLYSVLGSLGFRHETIRLADDHWSTVFVRDLSEADRPATTGPLTCGCTPVPVEEKVVEIDLRGLEPPQPMVQVLEGVTALRPGDVLKARTDRRPLHLIAVLGSRGCTHESEEQADGSWITVIRLS